MLCTTVPLSVITMLAVERSTPYVRRMHGLKHRHSSSHEIKRSHECSFITLHGRKVLEDFLGRAVDAQPFLVDEKHVATIFRRQDRKRSSEAFKIEAATTASLTTVRSKSRFADDLAGVDSNSSVVHQPAVPRNVAAPKDAIQPDERGVSA